MPQLAQALLAVWCVTGTELLRKVEGGEEKEVCFGLTFPLLTKADGRKFGKSEDGAVWLSAGDSKPGSTSCCRASGSLHK